MQAVRLNGLENRRLQMQIKALRGDLHSYLTRMHREEQGLKYHFKNVVRVVKPNPAYQRWKQAHAQEIAQDEAKDLIESIKRKEKLHSGNRDRSISSLSNESSEPLRPLLVLLDSGGEQPAGKRRHLLRPRTSPANERSTYHHRINPLIALLDEYSENSNLLVQQQQHYPLLESPLSNTSSPAESSSTRRFLPNKLLSRQRTSSVDVLYRMALQNQAAFKATDKSVIEDRKLKDKEFASQHRALKGSIRMARLANRIN